jgi:hypothetical protein
LVAGAVAQAAAINKMKTANSGAIGGEDDESGGHMEAAFTSVDRASLPPLIFETVDRRALFVVGPLLTLLVACAPTFRAEVVGRAFVVAPRGAGPASPVSAVIAVAESPDAHALRYLISLPRAVQLKYRLACPSAEREGTVGETFESYRDRRLEEIERDRKTSASMVGALVGTVAPPIAVGAGVAGPTGSVAATGYVNPGSAAASTVYGALPAPALPPGDTGAQVIRGVVDLGPSAAGRCAMAIWSDLPEQETSGVQINLELTRIVNVDAEEQARTTAARAEQDRLARAVRARVILGLSRAGADPLARGRARALAEARAAEEQRRRDAIADEARRRREDEQQRLRDEQRRRDAPRLAREREAESERQRDEQTRLEREARERDEKARRAQVEQSRREGQVMQRRRLEWEARQRAFALRGMVIARLIQGGADPDLRRRLDDERIRTWRAQQQRVWLDRQQAQTRARERIDGDRRWALQARTGLIARLMAAGADPNYRRRRDEADIQAFEAGQRGLAQAREQAAVKVRLDTQAALDLRVLIKLALHRDGAVDRTAPPPPPVESPPPPPFPGAVWIAGRYDWNGIAWVWASGTYQRPPDGAVWVPPADIAVGGTLVVRPGRWVKITVGLP